jgi:hypothetical protein
VDCDRGGEVVEVYSPLTGSQDSNEECMIMLLPLLDLNVHAIPALLSISLLGR